jgi:hypothetical protein
MIPFIPVAGFFVQRLLTICSVVALSLGASATLLWIRSHQVKDQLWFDTSPHTPPQQRYIVWSAGGRVTITWHTFFRPSRVAWRSRQGKMEMVANQGWNNRFGEKTDGSFGCWSLIPGWNEEGQLVVFGLQGRWEDAPADQAVYRTLHLPYILLVAMFASVAVVTAIKARLKFSLRTLFIVLTLGAVLA